MKLLNFLCRHYIWSAVILILLGLLVWTLCTYRKLTLTELAVSSSNLPSAFDGFRIAQVSDLHNTEFGENNCRLLSLLRKSKPDLIAITGDMIDSRHTDVEAALRFAAEAVKIAPCYYAPGNHESRIPEEYKRLKEGLCALGVVVLENENRSLQQGEDQITVAGVENPDVFRISDMKAKLKAVRGDGFTLLLSHRPELFKLHCEAEIDLVLAGHAHGGQIRIPVIGGVFAPGQGLFPKYDAGRFAQGKTQMVVSRGIRSTLFPLRINNPPEIVLITLQAVHG